MSLLTLLLKLRSLPLTQRIWKLIHSLVMRLLPSIDFHKMQTWVVVVLFLILFSAQLVLRHSDKAQVETNTLKVVSVEKKLDSIAIATRITDQIKTLEIKRMHRENQQLEQIIVSHDENIRLIKKELMLMKKSEKEAMKRIEKMTDQELLRFYESLQEPKMP